MKAAKVKRNEKEQHLVKQIAELRELISRKSKWWSYRNIAVAMDISEEEAAFLSGMIAGRQSVKGFGYIAVQINKDSGEYEIKQLVDKESK